MTRTLATVGFIGVMTVSLMLAQDDPPVPPTPPAAPAPAAQVAPVPPAMPTMPAMPRAMTSPAPAAAPAPPRAPKPLTLGGNLDIDALASQFDFQFDPEAIAQQAAAAAKMQIDSSDLANRIRESTQNWKTLSLEQTEKLKDLTEKLKSKNLDWDAQAKAWQDWAKDWENQAQNWMAYAQSGQSTGYGAQGVPYGQSTGQGGVYTSPGPAGRGRVMVATPKIGGRGSSGDRLYDSGKANIDSRHLDNALTDFSEVISRGGTKVEGALYYKAYTLNKLGRRDEALNLIGELRKTYPNSHWLEDAKALETDIRQSGGKPVSAEELGQDDLKLLALDGLMQTDPERAFPVLEGLIKGPHSPSLRRQAVFVLAKNQSPRAQTLLDQLARGTTGNPDLQLTALSFVVDTKDKPNRAQLLSDVYGSTTDPVVKRVVLNTFGRSADFDHLLQILKTEKDSDLREAAISALGSVDGQPQLWQIYSGETTAEGKAQILRAMYNNGNTEKLSETARTEKDPAVRKVAVQVLASYKGPNISTSMVAIYENEQDSAVKKTIISTFADRRDAKSLITIGRKEKDIELKRTIVSRLVSMHTPEANDFLLEILK